MAKSPSFFGLRRGSTKSLTFQVLNGRQVTKDRVYDVKNPRTFSQMQQRMVMATAAAAYAGMREIVDHSFEGITYGQPTMSEFIRLNAKMLRDGLFTDDSDLSFNPYKNRNVYRNPYIVSKGSLKINVELIPDSFSDSRASFLLMFPMLQPGATLRSFWQSLGISENGYLTVLCVANSPETNLSQFGWIRITPMSNQMETVIHDTPFNELFEIESNVPCDLEGQLTEGTDEYTGTFDFDQGGIQSVSLGVIGSDKKLSWLRSSCSLKVVDGQGNPSPASTALATYPVGTDYILNGGTV